MSRGRLQEMKFRKILRPYVRKDWKTYPCKEDIQTKYTKCMDKQFEVFFFCIGVENPENKGSGYITHPHREGNSDIIRKKYVNSEKYQQCCTTTKKPLVH